MVAHWGDGDTGLTLRPTPSRVRTVVLVTGDKEDLEPRLAGLERYPELALLALANGEAAGIGCVTALRPSLVVLALASPEDCGRLTRGIRRALHDVLVVWSLPAAGGTAVQQALDAGADALVTQDAPLQTLVDVLVTSQRGVFRVAATLQRCAVETAAGVEERGLPEVKPDTLPADLTEALSPRQRAVLRLVCLGYTSKEIATQLGIGPTTVDTYRHRLLRRLGLRHRSELVRFARDAGFLDQRATGQLSHSWG